MSDQLLSQADVDALITSLTESGQVEQKKPVAPPKGEKQSDNALNRESKEEVSAAMSAKKPSADKSRQEIIDNKPKKTVAKKEEGKQDISNDVLNKLNEKVNELARQVEQSNSIARRLDVLEKRMISLESKVNKHSNNEVEQKVKELSKEVKKIVTGLKGTPGYAVKYTFKCEKCKDKGHVAVKYRCTNCGNERWYGWWPEK